MTFWSKLKTMLGFGKDTQKSGGKKNGDAGGGADPRWKVEKRHNYDEVDLENEIPDANPQEQYKVVKQPRSYEEVTLGEDQTADKSNEDQSRLSEKATGGQLNYVDVEFTKPKKKKKTTKKDKNSNKPSHVIPPSVEYSEVTIQDQTIHLEN